MNKEELRQKSKEYADRNGFVLQQDSKMLDMTLNGLLRNEQKYGAVYCPCRRVTGNKKEDEKIICPCIFHKDEIKKDGHCKCMLFFRKI